MSGPGTMDAAPACVAAARGVQETPPAAPRLPEPSSAHSHTCPPAKLGPLGPRPEVGGIAVERISYFF